jgi:predicted esterase
MTKKDILSSHEQSKGTFIFFHGYGSSPDQLFQFLVQTNLTKNFSWFLPCGSKSTELGGFQWHDLFSFSGSNYTEEVIRCREKTCSLIQSQKLKPPLFLMGFSQGGFMALDLFLSYGNLFDGAAVFSGYSLFLNYPRSLQNKPLYFSFGNQDQVVPGVFSLSAKNLAQSLGCQNVVSEKFEGGHTIYPQHFMNALDKFNQV